MLYRTLGRNNIKVSQLGFGLMRLPVIDNNPANIDEEKAIKLIRYAIDKGVNYLDTAYPYHGLGREKAGMSEPFLARVLKDGYREKVNVATKLPSWLIKTKEDMDKYLNQQLERLEVDSIDFYLLHTLNGQTWNWLKSLGVLEFLDKAIADGKIKQAGFSFHDDSVEVFKEIIDSYPWDMCQIQYNYMDENYQAGREGLEYAGSKGIGVVIMEPLKGGSLANNLPEASIEALQKVNPNRTPAEWSFRWLWNHKEIKVVLSGMNKMEQLMENIEIASNAKANSLTQQELDAIKEAKMIMQEKVQIGCTGCGYCMPCPAGVDIPKNFAYYNNYFRFDSPASQRHELIMYKSAFPLEKHAEQCVECGECESHCPQGIKIREQLKNVTATFKMK